MVFQFRRTSRQEEVVTPADDLAACPLLPSPELAMRAWGPRGPPEPRTNQRPVSTPASRGGKLHPRLWGQSTAASTALRPRAVTRKSGLRLCYSSASIIPVASVGDASWGQGEGGGGN